MLDILAIIPLRPSWEQMIYFSLMGFGIVLIVLAALSAISSVVGVFFKKYDAAQAAAKAAPQVAAPKAPAAKGVSPEVSKEHEFVISAAVAAVLVVGNDVEYPAGCVVRQVCLVRGLDFKQGVVHTVLAGHKACAVAENPQ